MTQRSARERFDRELGRLLGQARRRALVHGLLATGATAGAAFGAAAWACGGEIEPPAGLRLWMLAGALLLTGAAALATLGRGLAALRDRERLGRVLERDGSLRNVIVAAEEAGRRPDRWGAGAGVPAALLERLYAAAAAAADGLRLGRRLPLPRPWLTLVGALGVAIVLSALGAAQPERLGRGAGRLARPWRPDAPPARVGLYLETPRLQVVAGRDVTLGARDFGRAGGAVACEIRTGTGLWRPVETRRERAPGAPYARWIAVVAQARESFVYRFRRDGIVTPEGAAEVRHPPLLAAWGGTLRPPPYTRLPDQTLDPIPSRLQAPAGSRLSWRGLSSGAPARAAVLTAAGDSLPLAVRGDTLRGETRLDTSFVYVVALADTAGLLNEPRLAYAVDVVPDLPPSATLARPDDDGRLPAEGPVALQAGAADDWGLARLELLLRREQAAAAGAAPADSADAGTWQRATVWPRPGPAAIGLATPWGEASVTAGEAAGPAPAGPLSLPLALSLDGLALMPGDALAVCLEAIDNRDPGPPGRSRSAVIRLALPSAAEILAEQMGEGEDRSEALADLRRRGGALEADREKRARELRRDDRPGWEKQQQLQAALERQQALQQDLQEVAGQLQRDLDRMAQENLGSVELLEKMQQVAELLRQVDNPELDRLLEQLRDRAAQLSPEQLRQAMEEAARNRREYEERLDRAIGLLREMAREQEMEGLTSVVERLIREQQALLDAAGADSVDAGRDDAARGEQAQRQAALAEEARRLEERMREALGRLARETGQGDEQTTPPAGPSPAAEEMRKALEEALRELESRRPEASMDEASRRLQASPPSESPPAGAQQQALRDLAALYHVLLRGQLGMQMAMQQHAAVSLRRIAADLLALSERQERIAADVPADLHGVAADGLTRDQNRVARAARGLRDRLQALSAQSPAATARLVRDLDALVERLAGSLQALELRAGAQARREAREALGGMNRVVIGLLTAAQQAGSGAGGAMSMPSASEQLQRMAREQAGLNGLADQLRRQLQQSGPTQEQRARMQRLQSDQGGIAGQLQELDARERARPDGERILGDLRELAREMERVADDLGAGRLDDGTLARQERILSRLLDAHNSVRKRDFTQRRESRAARDPLGRQAGDAPVPDAGRAGDPYRLRREPVEQAPPDYRDLVRRYFRALEGLLPDTPAAPAPAAPGGGGRP